MLRNYIAHSADIIQGRFWGAGHYDIGCNKLPALFIWSSELKLVGASIIESYPPMMVWVGTGEHH